MSSRAKVKKSDISRPSATNGERDERSSARNDGPERARREISDSFSRKIFTGPTCLTILRMLLSIAFVIFAVLPDLWARITALIIFIIAAITDKIDGIWARKSQKVTDLGAFLDPLADKMLVNLAFLVLVYLNIIPLWVFAVILIRDFAVDGMRMMVARTGTTVAASFLGKLKTTLQMTALIIILANQIFQLTPFTILGNITLYIAVALTIISGINYLYNGFKKIIR